MKFNIKHALAITVFLISQGIAAQFYAGLQSGIGSIQSNVAAVQEGNRLGGAVKAGYIYVLNNHFGIGSGLEFSQYRQQVSLAEAYPSMSDFQVDPSSSAFIYTVTAGSYKEKQILNAVQIPIFIQYKTNMKKGVDFNLRAGAKYFLPVSYKIKAAADYVNGTAYYPDVNLTIDDFPEYGFGNQTNYSASGEYKTKAALMSFFELGFTFDMGAGNALYAALFVENGHGSILDQNNNESYIGYNPASVSQRKANGLYSADKNTAIKPAAFGVTLEWNFKKLKKRQRLPS